MKRLILLAFTLAILCIPSSAVEPFWRVDFGSVFDNREGDESHTKADTYFFTTLAPQLGLSFSSSDYISGGAVWTQPVMNGVKNGKIIPTLYYRHEGQRWKFSMGMFPQTQLREPLPGFLWCDSLAYFQKNLRGALVQFQGNNGYFDAYIDWRAMRGENRREAFNIMFHGQWQPQHKVIIAGAHALMNHFAKTYHPESDEYVVDNFLVNPYIGINMTGKTALDSLQVRAGALYTVERNREDNKWKTPGGLWVDVTAELKIIGVRNSLYAGGKLFPLYGRFGNLLYQGEPYYGSSFYNRTDVYARIIRNKYMDLEAQLNFNFTKTDFMFYQRLILNIYLDGKFK